MGKRLIVIVVLASALAGWLFYNQSRQEPPKVSGFIEADEVRLASRVGGRVSAVHIQEGDTVKTGDGLIELEPFDLLEKKAQAAADRAARQAELDALIAGPRKEEIAAAQAGQRHDEAMVGLAQLKYDRLKEMFQRSAATPDERDTAQQDLKAALATLEAQQQVVAEMLAGSRAEDIERARAAVNAAEAALKVIDAQIAELTITAPVDGEVEALDLQVGDMVAPNAPVMALLITRSLWVRAYVPEDRLNLQVGQTLPVTVDSYPGKSFSGHITFIARQAEFTPGNVQTPEDRAKQVFRIKVTLDEGLDVLRPGMNADVWLNGKVE
ncbi:MAG: HlyD family efflux transporter periplasmic adaptor subunit [Phycisphaera sp.]|nr:HlyD family efflux transporter periplasmic adaptor subunit [Phycisphaera sp.]